MSVEVRILGSVAEFKAFKRTHPYFNVSRPKIIHPGKIPNTVKDWAVFPTDEYIWWLFKYEIDQLEFFHQFSGSVIWRGVERDV
jgi:hypothetical protein